MAPYDSNLKKAVAQCFDRVTSLPVATNELKSFKEVISLYHLHPESKFFNGDYLDRGMTQRRYVHAIAVRNIGKEANEWEEQFYIGYDEDEQINYGIAPSGSKRLLGALKVEVRTFGGQRRLAIESGVSRKTVSRLMKGKKIRSGVLAKIRRAIVR